jgi:XapX domain-containing protein
MKSSVLSFVIGAIVGGFYGAIHVRSPAPPLVALAGLFGMVLAEGAYPRLVSLIAALVSQRS